MKMSIIIPCYNEERNIPLIVQRFNEIIDKRNIEVILVNNGSVDNSKAVINDLMKQYDFLKCVEVEINNGYGYGILKGLDLAEGDYVGWTHADMQTDPLDVIEAYDICANSTESIYIKGNRRGRNFSDNVFTAGMSIFETVLFGCKMYDINAQPNIFPNEFIKKWKNPPYDFSLDLYAYYLAQKEKIKIIRIPVNFPKRINGVSSWNRGFKSKINFIKRIIDYSFKLRREI